MRAAAPGNTRSWPPGWAWTPPDKLGRDEIIAAFADGWHVDSIESATIDARTEPAGVRAWLVAVTRR